MSSLVILGGQEELVKITSTGMAISTAHTKAVLAHWMAAVTQVWTTMELSLRICVIAMLGTK